MGVPTIGLCVQIIRTEKNIYIGQIITTEKKSILADSFAVGGCVDLEVDASSGFYQTAEIFCRDITDFVATLAGSWPCSAAPQASVRRTNKATGSA